MPRTSSKYTKRPTKDPKGRCGTQPGYQAHHRRGEQACKACKAANSEYQRRYYKNGPRKGLKPSEVYQDQRRGSQGQAVADPYRRADAPTPEQAPVGVQSTAPKRGQDTPPPAPAPEPVPQERLAPAENVPEAPAYLRAQGRDLWDRVLSEYELNPAGQVLLGEACRTVDRLERMAAALSSRSTFWFELEAAMEDAGADSLPEFNVVVNGMVGEARQLQAALRSTLKELGITEVTPRAVDTGPRESLTDELKRKRQERLAAAKAKELEG